MVTFLLYLCVLVSLVTLVLVLLLGLCLICSSLSSVFQWKLGVDLEKLIAFNIGTYGYKSPITYIDAYQVFACCSLIFIMKRIF